MSTVKALSVDIASGSAGLVNKGLQCGKLIVGYGRPVVAKSTHYTQEAAQWGAKNPVLATCVVVGATGTAIFAAPALITAPMLSSLGFTASGIQAGSIATAAHSLIGNVAAGSVFAAGQSAGAGGTGLTIINGAAQAGGAIMSVGSAGIAWLKTKETTI